MAETNYLTFQVDVVIDGKLFKNQSQYTDYSLSADGKNYTITVDGVDYDIDSDNVFVTTEVLNDAAKGGLRYVAQQFPRYNDHVKAVKEMTGIDLKRNEYPQHEGDPVDPNIKREGDIQRGPGTGNK